MWPPLSEECRYHRRFHAHPLDRLFRALITPCTKRLSEHQMTRFRTAIDEIYLSIVMLFGN